MNVYKMETRRSLKGFIIWTGILAISLVLFMLIFPSMSTSEMQSLVNLKVDALPEALLKAFNMQTMPDFTDLLQFIAYCLQFISMAACIYAVMLGASSLIKEESEGTIEFLYAKPVSRTQIVTAKLLSNLTILLGLNLILFIVSAICCVSFAPAGYSFMGPLAKIFLYQLIINVVFFSIGFAFSTVMKKSRQSTSVGLGVFFGTYFLGIMGGITTNLDWLRYFSPFNYAVPNEVIKNGFAMDTITWIVILAVVALSIVFTYSRYSTKDMKL